MIRILILVAVLDPQLQPYKNLTVLRDGQRFRHNRFNVYPRAVNQEKLSIRGISSNFGGIGALASSGGGVFSSLSLTLKFSERLDRGDYGSKRESNQKPIRRYGWPEWIRFAISALLFYTGCLLAYRGELRGYGVKGVIGAYLLMLVGLIAGFAEWPWL